MRVLFYADRFRPYVGGVEVISAAFLPPLARRGIEITVVTTADGDNLPEREQLDGLDVRRLQIEPALRSNDIEKVVEVRTQLAAIKAELRPDLMHVMLMGAGIYFPVMTARSSPCPILLEFQGSWPPLERGHYQLVKQALDTAAWVTACSAAALEELVPIDPALRERATVIHNGIDPSGPEPRPVSIEPPVLLCAARLEPTKGLDLAIEAVRLLVAEFPSLRLRIVGDGTISGALAAQAAAAGVGGAVELIGWRSPDHVGGLIDDATIVLVPSRVEGFGMIALEGMLRARPVVASRVGGLPEVLGDDGGVLIEPESPEAIAAAVRMLLRDPGLARSTGAAGRVRALARFSLDRCVDSHGTLYSRLAANAH